MKLQIKLDELRSLLARVIVPLKVDPAAGSSLRGFGRLEVSAGRLSATAIGPVVSCTVGTPLDGTPEDGACACNLEMLADMLAYAPASEIADLDFQRASVGSTMGQLHVRVGKSKFKTPCAHPDVFRPVVPESAAEKVEIQKDSLVDAIEAVQFASAPNDADNVRSNICFSSHGGKLHAVAMNGIECCICEMGPVGDLKAFLPSKVAKGLNKMLVSGPVTLIAKKNGYLVQDACVVRFPRSPEAEAKFPDVSNLLAVEHVMPVSVPTERLKDMVGASKHVSRAECLLSVSGGELTFWAKSSLDGSEYRASVSCVADEGVAVEAGMCPLMLGEFLSKVKTDSITLEFNPKRNDRGWPWHVKMSDGQRLTFFVKTLAVMSVSPGG
jgi:DNA polymerase III sliding clamp (beta) subunit (PCNA family)